MGFRERPQDIYLSMNFVVNKIVIGSGGVCNVKEMVPGLGGILFSE